MMILRSMSHNSLWKTATRTITTTTTTTSSSMLLRTTSTTTTHLLQPSAAAAAATQRTVRRSLTTPTTATAASAASAATATTTSSSSTTATTTPAGQILSNLTAENPYRDVLHYQHKNRTWSLQHVEYYTTALAIGLLENGFQPAADIVLSWLPEHFSEQMVLQFACAKAGLVLYTLDPAQATTDPTKAEQALAAALELTKANILVSQEAGSDVNYVQLAHNVIPELRIFDTDLGMPFVTPRFPHLRMAIQTGFDQDDKAGWYPLRHMLVPSGNLDSFLGSAVPKLETPLAGELVMNKDGLPVGTKVYTNQQVMDQNIWPTFNAVLKTEFQDIEGVGVIF